MSESILRVVLDRMWNRLPGILTSLEDQKIFWELGEIIVKADLSSREKKIASEEIWEMCGQLVAQDEISAQDFLKELLEKL